MTKKAAIFHGTGCNENSFWIPWLKKKLEADGYDVWTPSLPPDQDGLANLNVWTAEVLETAPHKRFDLMIGHSAGAPLILRLLSTRKFSAAHTLLVAGFLNPLEGMEDSHPTYPHHMDYDAIKEKSKKFTFIHSDNDPWGCNQLQGEAFRITFGGTLIVQTGEIHFGSEYFNQPYPEFPLLYAHTKL